MAFTNFKELVWSKQVQMELEKLMVFQSICNTKFQGEIAPGKEVKIIGVGRPAVGTYTPGSNISAAETPADTSVYLKVDQFKYTHFNVDDVDDAQANTDIMKYLMKGSATELAETRDTYIAALLADAGNTVSSRAVTTAAAAKKAIDDGFGLLWDRGVKINADVTIVVNPWFYNLFKDKLTELYTNNVELIRQGIVGTYNGAMVKMSNNVYNDGTDDYLGIVAKDAIAFAGGIHKVEAYRPDLQFSDAVKVLDCFGAKVVRPKEMTVLKVRKA